MATAKLSRNLPANQNSLHKWTYSGWVKRCDLGAEIYMFNFYDDANNRGGFRFNTDDTLLYYDRVGGSTVCNKVTNRVFRDTAAWYHVMVAVDKSVSSPDTKIYVNGVEETSFSTDNDYSQNQSTKINDNDTLYINSYDGSSDIKSQIQTHVHWVSGYTLTPATFGETDSTSGIWKPKTAPSVTYGTNGFFLKFENSAAMGTDSSGNGNNFTVAGSITQNIDTPTNNYANWNVIMNNAEDGNWSNGNLTIAPNGDDTYLYAPTTIGISSGKWYSEHMITGGNGYGMLGAISEDNIVDGFRLQTGLGTLTNSFGFRCRDGAIRMASSNTTYGSAPGTSDAILGMALDMDNKKVWYHINGTYVTYGGGVGNPGSGTYGFSFSSLSGETFLITCGDDTTSGYGNFKSNFGSGFFGTASVSSANADANGHGLFEYAVPSGFYTLNTKNLKEFG